MQQMFWFASRLRRRRHTVKALSSPKATFFILVLSRLLLLSYCIITDVLFEDHLAQDVATFTSSSTFPSRISTWLLPFTKWDAAHYLNIARDGYTRELELVFFPMYPWLIKAVQQQVVALPLSLFSNNDAFVVAAITINLACFMLAFLVLFLLLEEWHVPLPTRQLALVCFCCNPANIFFASAYTESFFALFSWLGMLLIEKCWRRHQEGKEVSSYALYFFAALASWIVASSSRSNGSLNVIFPLHFASAVVYSSKKHVSLQSVIMLVFLLLALLPIVPFWVIDAKNRYAITTLGSYSFDSSWSSSTTNGSLYSLLQLKYWNVGLFQYYQLKQLPNFVLALPISLVSLSTLYTHTHDLWLKCGKKNDVVKDLWHYCVNEPKIGHMLHLLLLLLVALLIANVQVSTRLVCSSCPLIYVGFAQLISKASWSRQIVFAYFVTFNLLGVAAYCNFLPFT